MVTNLGSTYGVALIAVILAAMLHGITQLQTCFYFWNYPKDAKATKILVFVIWVLDALHIGLISWSIYYYLIINYDNPSMLSPSPTYMPFVCSMAVNVLISCLVQSFFAVQIYRLCGRRARPIVTGILVVLIVLHFASGIGTIAISAIKNQWSRERLTITTVAPFGLFTVLADVSVATGLCVLFRGNHTHVSQTNKILKTLTIYAINRCILTSIVATTEVFVYALSPTTFFFVIFEFTKGKLWANSMLATLNSRQFILRANPFHPMDTVSIVQIPTHGNSEVKSPEPHSTAENEAKVETVVERLSVRLSS